MRDFARLTMPAPPSAAAPCPAPPRSVAATAVSSNNATTTLSAPALSGPAARLRGRLLTTRRLVKNLEEESRAFAGAALRRVGLERRHAPAPLFEPVPFDVRPFPHRAGDRIEGSDDAEELRAIVATPAGDACMHTFFDVCPISPSGRYLAVTRLPFEHRGPWPGDMAEVCLVDLCAWTIQAVYRTSGWALQLGANLQWHPTSDILYTNDLKVEPRGYRGVGVAIDPADRSCRRYDAPFYAVDPSGRFMLGPALDLVNRTQYGYGVPEGLFGRRRLARGAAGDEGIWRTDLESGRVELLASIADLVDASPARALLRSGVNYLFHTKIAPCGGRLFQVLRSIDLADRPGAVRSRIMTLDTDGGHVREALPHEAWDRGGHHPSWLADGDILMNLVPDSVPETAAEGMRFVRIAQDGSGSPEPIGPWRGSGHPSVDPTGRFLVTDAYLNEGFGAPDGRAPLRLIDLAGGRERHVLQLDCGPPNLRARRVDPHPVWGRDGRSLILNTVIDGRRQVVIADLGDRIDRPPGERPTDPPSPATPGVSSDVG
ncbi:MAG: hypothetical protein KDE35_02950 [Geminicoccaceae bacterium]|nr:hypothetical protein [Geminicoccaceae bacterium]